MMEHTKAQGKKWPAGLQFGSTHSFGLHWAKARPGLAQPTRSTDEGGGGEVNLVKEG
jgi:hypothetical protein